MQSADDTQLLTEFTTCRSEEAFATLVHRHINLVYSAALRQVQNPQLAREVTQVVFIILSQKAHTLHAETILSGWLYRTARFAAANVVKQESRRQRREQEAHMQSMLHEADSESVWENVSPLLDEAMSHLGEKDRNAVILRYFDEKSLSEVGVALGTNEDTARKRVSRSVEKLRKFFTKRGTVLPAATLIGLLSTHSVSAAPAELASTIAAGATLKGTVAASSTLTLIKGTLKIMAWTKLKTAAVVGAAVILGGGTTAVVVKKLVFPSICNETIDASLWAINSRNLEKLPRIVLIQPTRFPTGGGWVTSGEDRGFGQNATVQTMLTFAYGIPPDRAIFPPNLPTEKFDFLVNLPSGRRTEFQAELRKQFGLIARRETREMETLVLKVKTAGAPGLKISQEQYGGTSAGPGKMSMKNQPVSSLVRNLERTFKQPIVDRTGLTGSYDIELKWSGGNPSPEIEQMKNALVEQLGLELIPSREGIEMLIVGRAGN